MKLHRMEYRLFLPVSIDEAWDYFSSPQNMMELIPKDMQIDILTENVQRIHLGQIIQYNVTPYPFMKIGWVTEITHMDHHNLFVDEQRFGPFAFWHHLHIFEEQDGGVLMTDILHYRVPLGAVGKLVNALSVERKLRGIFEHRFQVLENKFGNRVLTTA